MIHHKIFRQLTPHVHKNGNVHRAHAASPFALLVYLQILIVIVAGLYFIRVKAPDILGSVTFSADEIIVHTNAKRAENGLGALSANGSLASAASAKASDMFANNYWAHNSPSGKTPWSFISAAGYRYVYAGENLARDFNDAVSVVNAWMNSPSHKSNLLDGNFKEIGVAVSSGSLDGREGILVVQMFGSGVSSAPPKAPLAQVSPKPTAAPTQQPTGSPSQPGGSSPEPSVVTSPTPEPSPSPEFVADNEPTVNSEPATVNQSATVLASRQFSIAKGIAFGLVGFIFALFLIETVLALRLAHLKIRSGVIAHLALLGFVLLALWYAVRGAIL